MLMVVDSVLPYWVW